MLLLGSPALDTLIITGCTFTKSHTINISAPQLKQLEIRCCCDNDFIISAPTLVKFYWKDLMWTDCFFENQFTLEIANLDMDGAVHEGIPDLEDRGPNRMIKCLKGLYNVKNLSLTAPVLEAISQLPSELENWATPFSNLRYLCMETWLTIGCFRSVMFLLEKSLNVETFVLHVSRDLVHVPNTDEPGQVETSLKLKLNKLKFVEFRGVVGCLDELEYLKVLLNNATTLKKMAIIRTTWKWSALYKKRLTSFNIEVLALPRASSDITISFS
ncbi:hypothetical protein AQUCO_00500136v1 [Aquilegia coerulea]|uniref:FBD domain-containing protein n=1 Tax=Aquilegia coerulea TaxID=218851 RepID=A0A2G5EQR6_AQUCA|nr:hypothetical protein AQUCO_00500136v1 [Aquilegia coerulea]